MYHDFAEFTLNCRKAIRSKIFVCYTERYKIKSIGLVVLRGIS